MQAPAPINAPSQKLFDTVSSTLMLIIEEIGTALVEEPVLMFK